MIEELAIQSSKVLMHETTSSHTGLLPLLRPEQNLSRNGVSLMAQ